jgi:hypothetical protein
MSGFAGSQPIILPKLGGLYTFLRPVDVPSGYSPALQNVRFLPRAVLTRPGLTTRVLPPGNATFLGGAQFINNSSLRQTILLDNFGNIYRVSTSAATTPLQNPTRVCNPASCMHVQQSFGREFMSFFTGPPNVTEPLAPSGPIRHWDGNVDVNPPPPSAPTAADSPTSGTISAGSHNIAILFEMAYGQLSAIFAPVIWVAAGGKKLLITNIPLGPNGCVARRVLLTTVADTNTYYFLPSFKLNDNINTSITIDGSDTVLTQQGYPMSYPGSILQSGQNSIPALAPLSPDGPGSPVTVADSAASGSVAIGVHQVQVIWETRWGYLTAPGPITSWTAAGGFEVTVSNIPIGPWYVVARRILFTLSGGADFFYITSNRIGDNTTTSIDLDFSDVILAAGNNFNYIARNYGPMDSYGVGVYGGRLVTWGGLNTLKGNNLGFDGGWNFADGTPAGWVAGANYAGGVRESINVFCGEAWRITGDGFSPIRGQITNASIQPLLLPSTSYTVSVRLATGANGVAGPRTIILELFSPTVGLLSPSVQFIVNNTSLPNYTEFQGVILNGLAQIPSDTVLRVYSLGTMLVGENFYIDHIRIWPTQAKYEGSVVRISNPYDPETFDGVNGFVQISKDDGQQVVACEQLRSFYYIYKERSLSTTYDDGTNPPSLWFTRSVDKTIGAGSPNGVTSSDTYIINHWRSGAYLYSGGRPIKVSQEIQPTWLNFNWKQAWTTHVLLDTQEKQVFFFGPTGTLTQPTTALMLDYSEGIGQEDDPAGRKWDLDAYLFPINMSFKFETPSNTQALYFVGQKLYEHTGTDDDGFSIDSFYETAFVKAGDHGQDQFNGISYFAEGSGPLIVTLEGVDGIPVDLLTKKVVLVTNPGQQYEMFGNLESERAKIRFEMAADNANFILKGVCLYAIPNFYEERPQ